MIDHITFGVTDFARSTGFYDQALAPLSVSCLVTLSGDQTDGVKVAGYGDDHPSFWLAEEKATTGLFHRTRHTVSLVLVDAFHAAALRAGGVDNGAPGLRPQYHVDYYAAFVRDPDGHNIEAVCHRAAG